MMNGVCVYVCSASVEAQKINAMDARVGDKIYISIIYKSN